MLWIFKQLQFLQLQLVSMTQTDKNFRNYFSLKNQNDPSTCTENRVHSKQTLFEVNGLSSAVVDTGGREKGMLHSSLWMRFHDATGIN